MINALTTRLEIDIMQATELDQAIQYAVQHRMPAVVVHPQLVLAALMAKGRRRGNFKIITTVDWPKGETFGMHKLRGMTEDQMRMDGFEVMATAGKSLTETRSEVKAISNFLRDHLSQHVEVRYVLGSLMRPEEDALRIASVMKDVPAPAFLRTDHHLKAQVTKANVRTHVALVEKIRKVSAHPLKICGNIDSVRTIAGCLKALPRDANVRFAVSLQQAQAIVKDLQKQPDELRELLEAPAAAGADQTSDA